MNNPWKLFGLDPNTATEKEIRATYARLLKSNRPDVDPDGFHRVHGAYLTTLQFVRNRLLGTLIHASDDNFEEDDAELPAETGSDAQTPEVAATGYEGLELANGTVYLQGQQPAEPAQVGDEDAKRGQEMESSNEVSPETERKAGNDAPASIESDPPPFSPLIFTSVSPVYEESVPTLPPAESNLPTAWESRLGDLRLCLNRWHFHFPSELQRTFASVLHEFDLANIAPKRCADELRKAFNGNIRLLACKITDAALVKMILLEELTLCQEVIDHWQAHCNLKRMAKFGDALIRTSSRVISEHAGHFIVELAGRLAYTDPGLADQLASLAYRLLDSKQRGIIASKIETRIWLGKKLLPLRPKLRRFWTVQLASPHQHLDSKKYRVRRMVAVTVETTHKNWSGWSQLKEIMTPDLQQFTALWSEAYAGLRLRKHGFSGIILLGLLFYLFLMMLVQFTAGGVTAKEEKWTFNFGVFSNIFVAFSLFLYILYRLFSFIYIHGKKSISEILLCQRS